MITSGVMLFDGGVYLKAFGYGLSIERSRGYVPLFSERYGYTKALYFAGLRFHLKKIRYL